MSQASTMRVGDRRIGRVSLGGARWSIAEHRDDPAAEAVLERALDSGIDLIDTARAYTTRDEESHNERLIARVLRRRADARVLVATKGGHYRRGDAYPVDAAPASLRIDCRRSLLALGRDAHDLYYLHRPDPLVPLEESVGALAELRAEGLVARIGLCNVTTAQLRAAQQVTRIDAVQNRHNVNHPADATLLEACAEEDIAFFGYSPLAGVDLATVGPVVRCIAAEQGVDVTSILLAWLLTAGENLGILTGAGRASTLDSSLSAAQLRLTETEITAIAEERAAHAG